MLTDKWDKPKIDHIADLTLYLTTIYLICSVLPFMRAVASPMWCGLAGVCEWAGVEDFAGIFDRMMDRLPNKAHKYVE